MCEDGEVMATFPSAICLPSGCTKRNEYVEPFFLAFRIIPPLKNPNSDFTKCANYRPSSRSRPPWILNRCELQFLDEASYFDATTKTPMMNTSITKAGIATLVQPSVQRLKILPAKTMETIRSAA